MTTLQIVANTRNILGEGPVWDSVTRYLWWTDIQSKQLYRLSTQGELKQWPTPQRLCSFGLHSEGGLIAAFESGLAHYYPERDEINWLHKIETKLPHTRLNDGRCDPFGRFLAGTMVENQGDASKAQDAALYRLDRDGKLVKLIDKVAIANGICWSPDGKHLYFADSAKQTIWIYDYNPVTGSPSNKHIFATTHGQRFPDGSVTDSEGYLWNAQWGSSEVIRYSPDGSVDLVITLPVSQPSCIVFGGEDLKTLYITTAREGLSRAEQTAQPLAGAVFSIRTAVAGTVESRYRPRHRFSTFTPEAEHTTSQNGIDLPQRWPLP